LLRGSNPQSAIRNPKSSAGFTLLEVLVATAILGIAVSALLGAFSGSLRNMARAEGYERALLLGREQLNRMLIEGPLRPGFTRGRWDDSTRWEAEVERWDPRGRKDRPRDAELPPVAVIRFTIFWKGGTGEKSVTLETAKYDPNIR
jgi:general secretion pathway protein I